MAGERYEEQVRLLVQIIPAIAEEECFALKGGTAINLFYRDMPRLSVDIDLVFLPVKDRAESLAEIDAALPTVVGITRLVEIVRGEVGTRLFFGPPCRRS